MTIKIFMMPQGFPCGPQSSCCGPVGQSEGEIQSLKEALERELSCPVEVINVSDGKQMRNYLHIVWLLHAFGPAATPILTLDDEVISLGAPTPEQAVAAIRERLPQK